MRRLLALASAGVVALGAPPTAAAGFRLRGHANSVPSLAPGAGWGGVSNTAATGPFGSSGDEGYSDPPVAAFDAPQFVRLRGSMQFGIVARHHATLTEQVGGLSSNICTVRVAVDGGAFVSAPLIANPDSGETEYTFSLTESGFSAGLHEVRAIVEPCTGKAQVMQGPVADAAYIINGGGWGTISGTTLTVTAGSNGSGSAAGLAVGESLSGPGLPPNLFITALGTGTGGNGTYTLNQSLTVASGTPFVSNRFSSFYFLADPSNTLTATRYVASGGSDANSGLTAATAYATLDKAIQTIDTVAGAYGGAVCVVTPLTVAFTGVHGAWNASGYIDVRPASDGTPCDGSGSGALTMTGVSFNPGVQLLKLTHLTLNGYLTQTNSQFNSKYGFQWLDNVIANGPGVGLNNAPAGGTAGGVYVTNSTIDNYMDALTFLQLARRNSVQYVAQDGLTNTWTALHNTFLSESPILSASAGTATSGSPIISAISGVPGGVVYRIGATGNELNVGGCFATPATVISSTSTSVTLNKNATCNSTGQIYVDDSHADQYQVMNSGARGGVLLIGNDFSASNNGNGGEGLFVDGSGGTGGNLFHSWLEGNTWGVHGGSGQILNFGNPLYNVVIAGDTFAGNTGSSWANGNTEVLVRGSTCNFGPITATGVTVRSSSGC